MDERSLGLAEPYRVLGQSLEHRVEVEAIIGFSEVLNKCMFGELNEKQDEYLKDIYASGQHLVSLINDISTSPRSNRDAWNST